jgi:hypothetical protein
MIEKAIAFQIKIKIIPNKVKYDHWLNITLFYRVADDRTVNVN